MAATACRPEGDRSGGDAPRRNAPGTTTGRPYGGLTRRADFLAVAGGRRFRTGRMTVMALPRPGEDVPRNRVPATGLRVGFTVTRKIGHASERNRIKRRLRAATAAATIASPDADADVVVIARREAITAPFALLVHDLTRALRDLLRVPHKAPHQRGANG